MERERASGGTMQFPLYILLGVICGGRSQCHLFVAAGARRRLASRGKRDVVEVGSMTMRPWSYPCLSGSGTRGGRDLSARAGCESVPSRNRMSHSGRRAMDPRCRVPLCLAVLS